MPTKKKRKAATTDDAPPDPREPLPPTPANLTATLKDLKAVLADIEPPPPPEPPARKKAAKAAGDGSGSDGPGSDGDPQAGNPPSAEKETAGQAPAGEQADKAKPSESPLPQSDLVDALLHIYFAAGLPCGYGQEARRRIDESFVDRNEFRVTEAFEVEDLLRDLSIPDLFERCLAVRDSIAQIYNDQNGVSLAFLREAGISDRNTFFQRVPAVQPHVVAFLGNFLTIEEICFSDRSTLRAQQRFGLDPKNTAASKFVDEVRALLKPYGHLPLVVGRNQAGGKPNLTHPLSPACLLVRLAPAGRRR